MSSNNITTCPDVQNMNEDVRKETKLRGLLVLITGPVSFFPYDHSFISSKNMKKFKKKNMNEMLSSTVSVVEKSFDVLNTEFTLFFFCASWCKNSLIFTSTLAEFVYQHKDKCQCLAISNDHTNEAAARLCYGTGFMCLPVDHPNRSALYSFLSIFKQPVVIVMRNVDGDVITSLGREAIDWDPDGAIDAWGNNKSGASLASQFCTVS